MHIQQPEVLAAVFIVSMAFVQIKIKFWLRENNKSYSHEVWLYRCFLIYALLAVMLSDGFAFAAKCISICLVLHLVLDNPWMINHVEHIRAERRKEPSK